MIKDKLHTISDEDAKNAALLLMKNTWPYSYEFDKIIRTKHDPRDGTDAEESVDVFFKAIVTDELYKTSGWKDRDTMVKLIEYDRYHNYPYFAGFYRDEETNIQKYMFLANQIEAIEFLQQKELI